MKKEVLGIIEKKMSTLMGEVERKLLDCRCEITQRVNEQCKDFCSEQSTTIRGIEVALENHNLEKEDSDKENVKEKMKSMEEQISSNLALHMRSVEALDAEISRCRVVVEGKNGGEGCKGDIETLKEYFDEIDRDIRELKRTAEEREQYSRREILEIHGIPEVRGENTNSIALDIFHRMGVQVDRWAISRSHRQRIRGVNPSPIYVKLINHDIKDIIYAKRNVLRKMPRFRQVYIDENLTAYRRGLFRRVRKEIGTDWRVRTYDGAILLSRPNSRKDIKVTSYNHFYDILESQNWE